jgi:PAS domain S-box-containing protein
MLAFDDATVLPFDRVLDSLPLAAMVLGKQLVVEKWNSTLESWTSIARSEAIGRSLCDLFPSIDQPRFRTRIENALSLGTPTTFSAALHGSFLPVPARHGLADQLMIQETMVRRVHNSPPRVLVTIHDVTISYNQFALLRRDRTELVAARERLEFNEAKLRGIIDQSGNPIAVMDIHGILIDINCAALQLAGQSSEQLIGRPLSESDWWSNSWIQRQRLERSIEGAAHGHTDRFEFVQHASGQNLVRVDYTVSSVRGDGGQVAFIVLEGRDVTDQRDADAVVRTAFESAPNGHLMMDSNRRIVMVNRNLCRIFGYRRDELVGQEIEILVPHYVRDRHPQLVDTYLQDPSARPMGLGGDLVGVRKDGTHVPVDVGLAQIHTKRGIHVLASVVDVTERKRAEAKLVEFGRIQQEAAERLEASNKEMQRLLYAVSHDLKSPLVTVRGFAEILTSSLEKGDMQRASDAAARINRNAKTMTELIDAVLELSRISRHEIAVERLHVRELVDEVLSALAAEIDQADGTIVIGELPIVEADRTLLLQVFLNLVQNALKYGVDQHSRTIEIGSVSDDRQCKLFVRDFGRGIDSRQHERVFRLFHRVDNAREGSGLGLATVAKVIDRHRGKVWVESMPGQGATFWFTLPRPTDTNDEKPPKLATGDNPRVALSGAC